MDWSEEDLERPQILIDDVFGHSHPGSFHLDSLSHEISKGVYQNDGKPSEFHVTDICDGWAMGHDGMNYILLSREVICEMVEVHAAVLPWDGIVLVSSCDKAIPAHLMAASRINIPTIHVPEAQPSSPMVGSQVPPEAPVSGMCVQKQPWRSRRFHHVREC